MIAELAEELRRAGVGEVDASTRRRAEYSTDASLYRVVPQAVAFPRHADEVLAAVEVCRRLGVPITARGAGTSIAGNAVGNGLVLDFSRHLNRVRAIDPEAATAVVEPGVVLAQLQRAAQPHGLRFGPDPSTHNRATLGGMIGNNACGSRALGYGRTSDNVIALDMVTASGERLTDTSPSVEALRALAKANLATIRTEFGRFGRQVSGYSLEHLLPERFNLARALVGTEGTLGILLGATVNLVRAPAATVLVALGYPDMAAAADAVPALLAAGAQLGEAGGPVAVEGMDRRILDVYVARHGSAAVPELPRGNGWLFVELPGATLAQAQASAAPIIAAAGALASRVVTDTAQAAALWRIREDGAGLASRPMGGQRAWAGWEDAAVPPESLGAYLREFDALMTAHGVSGVPYGHFGDGCVHVRIDFPLDRPGGVGVFRSFLLDAAKLVASYGGSMSGEHGDGRARGELLPFMYSPAALELFAAAKAIVDPDDLLNPGVLVRPRPLDADLRVPAARPVLTADLDGRARGRTLAFAYHDDGADFSAAVHRCTGVGKCRADTTGAGGVMCPSYLATRDEKDSTRGRARVLQEMVNGTLVRDRWRSPEVHQALDLCLACKGCSSDCPTGVDMATYKAEVLHQTYRGRLRPINHYTLGWLPRWARLASATPALANWALRGPLAGPGKRLAGLDARRQPPAFARQTFRRWFRDRPQTSGDPVLLWVDTFTNHFSPQVGIAAVQVLERAGYSVRLSERGLCCGLTWISTGQLDAAKRILGRSLRSLAPAVQEGIPVVGLEPSCTAVFRGDATELVPDSPEVPMRTLAELLTERGADLPDLSGVTAVAQPHCHHHAVMSWSADRALLARAGATVTAVGGCCGLAGNFGVERGHHEVSQAVAETALLPAVRAAADDAVVLADGFSCRTQLDQFADRSGIHLAELLANPPKR